MASPTKHPKTGVYRIRIAVPKRLQATTATLYGRRAELIESLQTKDAKEARALGPAAVGRLRVMLEEAERAAQGAPRRITEEQVQALAGVFYRREVEQWGADPREAGDWEISLDHLDEQMEQDPEKPQTVRLSKHDLEPARELLSEHSLSLDNVTVTRVAEAVFRARVSVANLMTRRTQGDWSADKTARRFPTMPIAKEEEPTAAKVGFLVLLQGFASDTGWGRLDDIPISRALYDRKRTLARLATFLGHDDATKVTKADGVRWKEAMQARDLHASTIRNDLSECSAVWSWAIRNTKLPANATNPFEGIAPPKAAKRGTDIRPFTDDEAAKVLLAARQERGALHWLPWVCCATGARIGEIAQSVREDVFAIGGVTVIRFHDEGDGRSLKNAESRRTVPVHPALIAEGFLAYVAALPPGSPLFPDIRPDKLFGRHATEASRKVGRWLRATVKITDKRISPSHSWRHFFMDACRNVSMPLEVRSALTGHSAKLDESAGYGHGVRSLVGLMAEAMARVVLPLPRSATSTREAALSAAPKPPPAKTPRAPAQRARRAKPAPQSAR